MKAIVFSLVFGCIVGCGDDSEPSPSGGGVSESTFPEDETFIGIVCPAFDQVCGCNADRTSCPGNAAAVELYSCLWYAADFGDDGTRSGLGDGLRQLESTDEHLCRTLETPGQACPAKMGTAFGDSSQPYRLNIWEYLEPKPTDPSSLIDACSRVNR